jgi:hypothetical protein
MRHITPIYQLPSFIIEKEDSEIIPFVGRDKIKNLFDPS